MKKCRFVFIPILLVGIIITSCSTKAIPAAEISPDASSSYPANQELELPTRTPIVIPTPNDQTGIVTGKLVSKSDQSPISLSTVYLGEKLILTNDMGYLITMQEKSSPHSETDLNGAFVIVDVPPGEYVLLLFSPRNSTAIVDEKSGLELVFTVKAGEITELFTQSTNWP